jgi:hypothetical protein
MPISTTITNFTKSHQKIELKQNTHTSLCVNDVPLSLHQNLIVTQRNWPSPCTYKLWGPSLSIETSSPCMKKLVKDPFCTLHVIHTNYITFYVKKPPHNHFHSQVQVFHIASMISPKLAYCHVHKQARTTSMEKMGWNSREHQFGCKFEFHIVLFCFFVHPPCVYWSIPCLAKIRCFGMTLNNLNNNFINCNLIFFIIARYFYFGIYYLSKISQLSYFIIEFVFSKRIST